ncbi:MAG: hypothetical protein HQ541_09105 [Mariniphaga sp.]|nr:hypothetical protein [Mariniphaga sp.]
MKTKNNVQKTFLRTIAVIVSFVLLSLTVTAQGYWKQLLINNSFNHIASALIDNQSDSISEEAGVELADYFYNEEENSLQLESWMSDSNFSNFWVSSTDLSESSLEIEDWMLNSNLTYAENTVEESLELEPWMIN